MQYLGLLAQIGPTDGRLPERLASGYIRLRLSKSHSIIPFDQSLTAEYMAACCSEGRNSSRTRPFIKRPMKSPTPLYAPYDVDRTVIERTFRMATKGMQGAQS
jgi:hypothetical protein